MTSDSRRAFLFTSAVAGAGLLTGCAALPRTGSALPRAFDDREQGLLARPSPTLPIVQRGGADAAVLRLRAREVPQGADLGDLPARMRATMEKAQGVGLAGPQVGVSLRVVALQIDYKTDHPQHLTAVNPTIVARSDESVEGYEGCLSIAGVGGLVRRNRWIRLRYQDLDGRIRSTEAEGPNAVLWQHELDHLDGALYVDRLLGDLLPMEEVRRLRREAEKRAAPPDEPVSRAPLPQHLEGSLWTPPGASSGSQLARR